MMIVISTHLRLIVNCFKHNSLLLSVMPQIFFPLLLLYKLSFDITTWFFKDPEGKHWDQSHTNFELLVFTSSSKSHYIWLRLKFSDNWVQHRHLFIYIGRLHDQNMIKMSRKKPSIKLKLSYFYRLIASKSFMYFLYIQISISNSFYLRRAKLCGSFLENEASKFANRFIAI